MAASKTLSAAQRIERARKAHLAGAVNSVITAVVDRAPELTPEQIERLRAAFSGARSI